MSAATGSFSVEEVDATRRNLIRRGTLTINAGDYVSGGITLDLSDVDNPNNVPYAKFTRAPDFVRVINQPKQYQIQIVPGVALDDWLVYIAYGGTTNAKFEQHAVSAIDSALTGDTGIQLEFGTQKGH